MLKRGFIVAILLCALPLSGCVLLAFGAGAGGGYYVAKDERSFGRIVDDASITGSVKTKLIKDAEVDAIDINVDTDRGVVTLHGHVPSQRVAKRAVDLAGTVNGVHRVKSKLVVIP